MVGGVFRAHSSSSQLISERDASEISADFTAEKVCHCKSGDNWSFCRSEQVIDFGCSFDCNGILNGAKM